MKTESKKIIGLAGLAVLLAGVLGYAIGSGGTPPSRTPLAVVTIDRSSPAEDSSLATLSQAPDESAGQLQTLSAAHERLQDTVTELESEALQLRSDVAGRDLEIAELSTALAQITLERDALANALPKEDLSALQDAAVSVNVSLPNDLNSQDLATEDLASQDLASQDLASQDLATEDLTLALSIPEEVLEEVAAQEVAVTPEELAVPDDIAAPAAGPDNADEVQVANANAAAGDPVEVALAEGLAVYRNRDFRGAYQIWRPLAEQGAPRAQFYLGGLYLDGAGVKRDVVQAYVWLMRSVDAGYPFATELAHKVEAEMTFEQLAAAESILNPSN